MAKWRELLFAIEEEENEIKSGWPFFFFFFNIIIMMMMIMIVCVYARTEIKRQEGDICGPTFFFFFFPLGK